MACLLVALLLGAASTAQAQCAAGGLGAELPTIAGACCADPADCAAASGIPTACSTECSGTFASLMRRCHEEVIASPAAGDLEAFSAICGLGIGEDGCVSGKSCEDIQAAFPGAFPYRMQGGNHGNANICAESDNGMASDGTSECHTGSFSQGRNICFELGARLCSIAEMIAGETHGTGCGMDGQQLWTSSPCSAEGKGDVSTQAILQLPVMYRSILTDCL